MENEKEPQEEQKSKEQVVKSITLVLCPHCKKDMFVMHRVMPPVIYNIVTPADNQIQKDILKKVVIEKNFKKGKDLEEFLQWLGKEDLVISEDDVTVIISQLENNKK